MTLPDVPSLPEQEDGKQVDVVEKKISETREEACNLYISCKQRLLQVNAWGEISGSGSASFQLSDRNGALKQAIPVPGDLFRIDIPGPGSSAGDGFDWVQVESVEDHSNRDAEEEWIAITVRPSANPNTGTDIVAHFLDAKASSSFIVRRNGNTVSTEVHGRNEKPNTSGNIPDKIRNVLVGSAAALGISAIQWKKLVHGLLNG